MNHMTNLEHAAMLALGLNPRGSSPFEARTRFREALQKRNLNPFRLGTMTFQVTVPAIAAITLMRHFNGTAVPWVGQETDEPTFDGFHRRAPDSHLFHADSADFEDAYLSLEEQGASLSAELASAGVNIIECLQPRTLGEPTGLLLCGTLVDFWELITAIGPSRSGSHPAASAAIAAIWMTLRQNYPLVTEAFVEVNP